MIATVTVTFDCADPAEAAAIVETWVLTPGAEVMLAGSVEMPQPPALMTVTLTEQLIVPEGGTLTVPLVDTLTLPGPP